MQVTKRVQEEFKRREKQGLQLIHSYLGDVNVGVFGSYARGDYLSNSDIDFCIIGERPDRYTSGNLRCDADEIGVDIVFVSEDYFNHSDQLFAKAIRRDWRKCDG